MTITACSHSLEKYKENLLQPCPASKDSVFVYWMGTAGLYIFDGETGFYIDPFVSRYGILKVGLGFSLEPQINTILEWIETTGGSHAKAVLASHSHYDHVMDAPYFARQTGALMVGSNSTGYVCRGAGLPEQQIKIISDRDTIAIGNFEITFIKSLHSPALFGRIPWPGEIKVPLVPPASASSYREGGSYAIYVRHPKGSFLHYGSAGIMPDIFKGVSADVVFLSLGGRKDTESLVKHVIEPTGAKRVIPIHFDNFFNPLNKELSPLIGIDMAEFWETMSDASRPYETKTLPIGQRAVLFH